MKLNLHYCVLITLSCLVAACGSNGGGEKDTAASSNQVLKGTINDDMIAYDTLKSQPPAAQITATSEPSAKKTESAKEDKKAPEAEASNTQATPTASPSEPSQSE